jgi:hypothetical protein
MTQGAVPMTATSSGGIPLIIRVLSLMVAIVAVFVGPFVARSKVQRQIRAASREAWMRKFREQVAAYFSAIGSVQSHLVPHTRQYRSPDARLVHAGHDRLRIKLRLPSVPVVLNVPCLLERRAAAARRQAHDHECGHRTH